MKKLLNWIIPAAFGLGLWFVPTPEGLTPQSWHLFAIFVATIVGFITQPLPIGGVSIVVITVAALTGTLKISEGISGFTTQNKDASRSRPSYISLSWLSRNNNASPSPRPRNYHLPS